MPFFVGISCPLQSSYCLKSTLGSFFHSETLTYRQFCKGLKRRAAIVRLSLSIRVTMTRLLMCFMNIKVNNVTEKYWKNNLIVLVEQLKVLLKTNEP